jgi:hypothetical protein
MKLIKILAASALAISAASAPLAPAAASRTDNGGANAGLHEFCTALIESGTFATLNYGECISFNVTSSEGFTAHFCDFLREEDLLGLEGFDSYSDCIRNLSF